MKKVLLLTAAIIVVWLVTAWATTADSGIPQGVDVFHISECGLVCVTWLDGSGDCYVCEGGCDVEADIRTTPSPTDRPAPTPTAVPTDPPDPTPTDPAPNPTQVASCNRGIGNFDEQGCDPGNSAGKGRGGGRRAGEDRDEDKGGGKK